MFDRYNRNINYLRVSITDRCNLRCVYCMPEEGIKLLPHHEIMSYEEIVEVVKVAIEIGVNKVRITGGEPLVRKDLPRLVSMIAKLHGIKDFGLTTNGILLEDQAEALAQAGLHRVNISLDTMNPEKFRLITRGGEIEKVFRGIGAARKSGLDPIKINCVVKNSSNEPDAIGVKEFCREAGLQVRFIHEMNLDSGCFQVVEGGEGGHCEGCNRLRLTANGFIKPCLFNDIQFNLREMGIREALSMAIFGKPDRGSVNTNNKFHNIGG
jgi:cyclic pyranopterin phosphate synthase